MTADRSPLALSLEVALLATLVVALTAIPLGYLLARRQFAGKSAVQALVTLPVVLPPTVLGYYLLSVFGVRRG